jgi:hypothetical protein
LLLYFTGYGARNKFALTADAVGRWTQSTIRVAPSTDVGNGNEVAASLRFAAK